MEEVPLLDSFLRALLCLYCFVLDAYILICIELFVPLNAVGLK